MALKTLAAVLVWSVVAAAVIGFATGAWSVAGLTACGAAVATAVAFSMRLTDKLAALGAVAAVLLGLVWAAVALVTGGITSFAMSWLVAIPMVGFIFGGVRLGGWLAALAVGLWGAVSLGGDALVASESWVGAGHADQLRLLELGALGFGVFVLALLRENFIDWMIFSLRQVAAEANAFVETAPVGLVTVDLDGEIFRCNRASWEIFGYEGRDELMGMHINELVEGLEPGDFEEADDSSEPPKNEEYPGIRADGETFPAEVAGARLKKDRGVVLVLRDITDHLEYQAELRGARDQALEASKAKSTFLANMSHELRTPLNAVIGYSEMLIEEAEFFEDGLDEAADGAEDSLANFLPDLTRIRTAGKHLLALINDILDLSKIEAGKMQLHFETFEVRELLDDIESTIKPLANKNNNVFELNVDEEVGVMHSDLTKLRQVLFNLLSNSCKFTEGGHVTLSAQPGIADEVVFTVSDDGIGMDDEQLARVFQAFTQADESTTREFGGTGLGLTITQHFCRELGGDVSVESAPGEGTHFHVRLPVDAAPERHDGDEGEAAVRAVDDARPSQAVDAGASGETVLVIDDDPAVRDLLTRMLDAAGYKAATAASGAEGLVLARELQPAAITLDVMMPQMDGWQLLSELKKDRELASIPVIMLTMVSERSRGFALGADDYLVKPIERNRLLATLDKFAPTGEGSVLVVEDDTPSRELVRRILNDSGWNVVEAENGREGLERAAESTPRAVILDLMMPEMDGLEFLTRFREEPENASVPVIVVTAKKLTNEEREILKKSADRVYAKSGIPHQDLVDEVRRLTDRGYPAAAKCTES